MIMVLVLIMGTSKQDSNYDFKLKKNLYPKSKQGESSIVHNAQPHFTTVVYKLKILH